MSTNDKYTILLVDDEPSILQLARVYLEREGFTVEPAGDKPKALVFHVTLLPGHRSLLPAIPQARGPRCLRDRRLASARDQAADGRGDDIRETNADAESQPAPGTPRAAKCRRDSLRLHPIPDAELFHEVLHTGAARRVLSE